MTSTHAHTHAHAATTTRVAIVATVALACLGLAAYGFGFIPIGADGDRNDANNSVAVSNDNGQGAACKKSCSIYLQACTQTNDMASCQTDFAGCLNSCFAPSATNCDSNCWLGYSSCTQANTTDVCGAQVLSCRQSCAGQTPTPNQTNPNQDQTNPNNPNNPNRQAPANDQRDAVAEPNPNLSAAASNVHAFSPSALKITMASSPVSGRYNHGQFNVPSLGLILQVDGPNDVKVQSLRLSGQANIDGNFSGASLSRLVPGCSLFDEGRSLADGSVDPDLGIVNFNNLGLLVQPGLAKVLTVKCKIMPTQFQANGDQYSLGLASSADVYAFDGNLATVGATIQDILMTNASDNNQRVIISAQN